MESDVTSTLTELERKLKELERELESVGRGGELDTDPAQGGWSPPPPAAAPPQPDPGPPPPGATPFTAAWHGSGGSLAAPPPPASPFNGAPPVPVTPPPSPWSAAGSAVAPPAPQGPPEPGLHRQLDELLAFRDRLVQATDDLVSELSRVLTELGADAPPPDPADTVLTGHVVVDAAPFADLATLAAFEQALVRTPGVLEASVRALDTGRATIDVALAGPVPLGAALRTTAPVGFAVTGVGEGRLTLTLSAPWR
ncbi:MAG TPA: hypothetical protein VGO71_13505 [Baekduia sp.]|nr:hypothetical protein [Baekduia sp.]